MPIRPIPRDQWPTWATWIASQAISADRGVGDTVHRRLGEAGELFKAAMSALGIECGCDARREEWNLLYPYTLC